MDVSVDDVTPYLLCVLMFLVLCMVSLNVFFIIKNGFYVRVNCWFCNQNTKVKYSDRNGFDCPHCQQYNGFDKNGDYNKIITAQYVNAYNTRNVSPRMSTSFNGLCNICNNNITLKAAQIAKYEPLDEKNYDIEIEHFEKQLEKTYKLCKPCQKHVNGTIKRQNAWLFANRLKNRKKFNIMSTQGTTQDFRPIIWIILVKTFLLLSTILIVLLISGIRINLYTKLTQFVFPTTVNMTDLYNIIFMNEFMKNNTNLENNKLTRYLSEKINISETTFLAITGSMFDAFLALFDGKSPNFEKLSRALSWIILILTTSASFSKDASSYVHTVQIFSCVWLICNYGSSYAKLVQKKIKRKFVLKKMSDTRNQGAFSDDDVDDDDSTTEDSMSSAHARGIGTLYSSSTANKTPRLSKTDSLLNKKLNNERLRDLNNLKTARNSDLDKHFDGLNLGAFTQCSKSDIFPQLRDNSFSPSNPFLFNYAQPLSHTGNLINSFVESSAYSANNLRSPFMQSPKPNLFINVERPSNTLFTTTEPLGSPNSIFNCQKSYTSYQRPKTISSFQNSAFRPVSSSHSLDNMSTRSILSPPKFVNNFKANEELVFNVGVNNTQVQSIFPSWPSKPSMVYKNVNNDLVNKFESNYCDKLSRSSSRSSGFMSGNEVNSRAVSLPSSRGHSPEKSFYDHLKID